MEKKIPADIEIIINKQNKRNSLNFKKRKSTIKKKNQLLIEQFNIQPLSQLFKNDPITLKLLSSIQALKGLNRNNKKKDEDEDEDKDKDGSIFIEEENPETVIKNIIKLIKSHKGLYFFLVYNRFLDDKILHKIATNIQFEQKPKKSLIWEEGDNSEKIYFLLKGKIAFIKKGNKFSEKEKYSLNENNIFGMLDVIYERKRKLSCLCLTECCYIYFEKDFFKKYMEEKINKVDAEKKSFLVKFFNRFIAIPLIKLERFISHHIEILFFQKNDIIYKEGDKNKCLYLIFNGEANLLKNINKGEFFVLSKFNQSIEKIQEKAKNIDYINLIKNNDNNNNNNNLDKKNQNLELLLNKANYRIMCTLGRGSVGGLEITTGTKKFKYNLISYTDFCAVIKINIEYLEDEHLKMLMINLLPVFLRTEKKIHLQIKKIKYIDHHIIPTSCQKFRDITNLVKISNNNNEEENKINNNSNNNNNIINLNISPNDYENNKTYYKIIQKIDNKFDTNEGGFIKMNNNNINLSKQKYFLKEQIKDSKRLDYKIFNYIKKYKKEHINNLKTSSFKMNYLLSDENIKSKKDNFFELILSKQKNKMTKKSHTKSELVWKFPSPRNKRHNLSQSTFCMNLKKRNKKKLKRKINSAKITKFQYQKRINEIFEDYYKKAFLIKDYSKSEETEDHKLVSLQLIREDQNHLYSSKNLLKKSNDFIKEIIIIRGKAYKEEGTNTYNKNETIENNNTITINSDNSFNINYSNKKSVTQFNSINEYYKTINNNEDDKSSEKLIKIVNNNYIRDIFYKNSNYNRIYNKNYNNKFRKARTNLNNIQIKNLFGNHQKNRLIFYDTGHFDMPLASKLSRTNK